MTRSASMADDASHARDVVATSTDGVRRVARYYDETQRLYSHIWSPTGVHYGLWDATTRTRQQAIRNLDRCVARLLDLPRGSRVLDAGCGIGGTSFFLHEAFGLLPTGITLSADQLRRAERTRRARGDGPWPAFRIADYLASGLPGDHFDGVIAIESACYAESKPRLLAEAWRMLRPGGRLVVADGFRGEVGAADASRFARMMRGMALIDLPTPDAFRGDLTAAGFVDVTMYDPQAAVLRSARQIARLSRIGALVCAIPSRIGLLPRSWLDHGLAGIAQRPLFEHNAVVYRIFSARKPRPPAM